jgi:hypothetical protein
MEEKGGYSKKLLAFFIAFFVVITFLAIYGAEHYNGHDETIELQQYCKVSNSDVIKGNNSTYIYYVTWGGSPTGDAGSWAIYEFLTEHGYNLSGNFTTVKSMANFEYGNTPGIIFNNTEYHVTYHGKSTIIVPVYLYGENLTSNTPAQSGLQALKTKVPEPVYRVVKEYTTEAIVGGLSIPSDNISSISHINSVTLITGPAGAYIWNGYLVNPGNFIIKDNHTLGPSVVLKHLNTNTNSFGISKAVEGLDTTIKSVD